MNLTDLSLNSQADVERLFAGCVFTNPISAVQQAGWLEPSTIINEKVRQFWSQIKATVTPGMNPDTAIELAISAGLATGIASDLIMWSQDIPFSQLTAPYANEISRRAYITQMSSRLGDLVKAIQKADDTDVKRIVAEMHGASPSASLIAPDAYEVATAFAEVVDSDMRSVPFYLSPLDRATGGMERQTLTILAARPSVGKTALGWQVAQAAAYSKKSCLFFSMEMSQANLWARAACPKIGTTWRDVRAGKLSPEQRERLKEESYALALQFEDNLRVIDTPQTTDTIWQMVAQYRPDLVVVDHLRLVKDVHISEIKRLGIISQRLKDIAKNFSCAMLLLAQLNRQSESAQDKRPILSHLRDSGEIEENGDLILMMHREEFQGEQKPPKSPTEIWVRKFRDGPRDVLIKLLFDPRQEWFEEMPR